MKLRLIQLTGLFAFVVTIIMLAPSYDGFGDPPWPSTNNHDPDFLIDSNGKRPEGASDDPRWESFNEITCGANGSRWVEAEAWEFRPGILEGGTSSTHTPGDHLSKADQLIFKLQLDGRASTSSGNAEGSLSPRLKHLNAHLVPSTGMTSHSGEGRINLEITELAYHFPVYINYGYGWKWYSHCHEKTAQKHEFKMDNNVSIYIDVRVETEEKSKASDFSITPTPSTVGSVSFGYSQSHKSSYKKLFTESFGIKAKVGNKWWYSYPGIGLQKKTADVYGTIDAGGGGTIEIDALYPRAKDTWCPGNPSPSAGHNRVKVPHEN